MLAISCASSASAETPGTRKAEQRTTATAAAKIWLRRDVDDAGLLLLEGILDGKKEEAICAYVGKSLSENYAEQQHAMHWMGCVPEWKTRFRSGRSKVLCPADRVRPFSPPDRRRQSVFGRDCDLFYRGRAWFSGRFLQAARWRATNGLPVFSPPRTFDPFGRRRCERRPTARPPPLPVRRW